MSLVPFLLLALQAAGGGSEAERDRFHPDSLLFPGLPSAEAARIVRPEDPALEDRVRLIHWPGGEGRADRTLRVLARHARLPALPEDVPARAVLYLAPDREIFDALTGGAVPHWGAGVAIPRLDRIVIPLFAAAWDAGIETDRTIRHEWAHLGLHDHLRSLRIPRWFDEGYAQWAAGGWDASTAWRLRVALAGGGTPPLDSLRLAWPTDRVSAELAYLLSASAVVYLAEGSSERGIELFLERWRESGDFEGAFRRTFGITTGTFERQWIEHVKRRYGWLLVLSQSVVFWLLLGVALLVLYRIRRRRDREKLARLRAGEPPDLPAWWEPPPHPPIGGFPGERREVDPPSGHR